MYKKIEKCRICGNTDLERVLDLGEQMLTGVFPREKDAKVTTGPLRLVKCMGGMRRVGCYRWSTLTTEASCMVKIMATAPA